MVLAEPQRFCSSGVMGVVSLDEKETCYMSLPTLYGEK